MTSINPKDAEAAQLAKPRLDLLEPVADEATAAALANGADRYGLRNYVQTPVSMRVYIGAMRRHLAALMRGEDHAPDSGVHHLGHVAANCQIILAAIEAGTLIDDREPEAPAQLGAHRETVDAFMLGESCPMGATLNNGGKCNAAADFSDGYAGCLADRKRWAGHDE